MTLSLYQLCLIVVLAPLFGSVLVGLFGKWLTRQHAHLFTIAGVTVSLLASGMVFYDLFNQGYPTHNFYLYEWAKIGELSLGIGFLIDTLTVIMMLVVTSVSLMVHIYTIGYMHEDPGY